MIRLGTSLTVLTLLAAAPRAEAGSPQPICKAPTVLDVMANELRKHDYYARIEPRLIDEVPYAVPNTVWCGVVVHTSSYDARIADGLPLLRCERHAFRVQALSYGFVVGYLR